MSPERSSSPTQEESATTPKMSVPASPVAGTPHRDAQSPISLLLAVAQSQNHRNGDDDLTSLSWLHERDVLKGMNINPSPASSSNATPMKPSNSPTTAEPLPPSDYVDDSSASAAESSSNSSTMNSPVPQKTKHPHHIPYDPLIHTSNKPPYSFSCLIFLAIEDSPQKALPVKDIYAWILEHFPYFKNAPTGWKNSVRHNLSLNKCFQKVEKAPNLGKGSLWTVDEQFRPNLIQALTRTPMHPTYVLDPSSYLEKHFSVDKHPYRIPNPELYPYLSKKLARSEPEIKTEVQSGDDESLDAVDAAAVMLSLKNGPRYRQRREKAVLCQIITTFPSLDHTYSAAASVDPLAMDESFESDEERGSHSMEVDADEEERKIKEGAETLLNLAGISTRKRSFSNDYDPYKRIKLSPQFDENENEECDERPMPFKPRLLRLKKSKLGHPSKSNKMHNNNEEWMKHRRELDMIQRR